MGEKSKSGETEEVARTGACEKHGLEQWGPLRGLKGRRGRTCSKHNSGCCSDCGQHVSFWELETECVCKCKALFPTLFFSTNTAPAVLFLIKTKS